MKRILLALFCALLLMPSAHGEVFVEKTVPADWEERDLLRITIFRTGESDCMLLETGGECMMVDGGADKWREQLRDALADRGITHMKYLFSTHPHDDHINGLYRIMQYGVTADEFVSFFAATFKNDFQKRTVAQAEKSGIPFRQLQDGDVLTLGDATLTVYHWKDGVSVNGMSALTRLEYGDCSALLCADITGDAQKHFMKTLPAEFIKADVVKAPHHGLTPFVTEFLDVVDPAYIWVTNYDNDKVSKMRSQAKYRSLPIQYSGAGTIILETDGTDWYVHQTLKQF